MNKCSFPNCGRIKHNGMSLCNSHYRQKFRGKPLTPIGQVPTGRPPAPPRFCGLQGCDLKHYAKNLCQWHYCLLRATTPADKSEYRTCSVPNCIFIHCAKNLCYMHYTMSRMIGKANALGLDKKAS